MTGFSSRFGLTLACELYNVGHNSTQQKQVDYAQLRGPSIISRDNQVKASSKLLTL